MTARELYEKETGKASSRYRMDDGTVFGFSDAYSSWLQDKVNDMLHFACSNAEKTDKDEVEEYPGQNENKAELFRHGVK